MQQYIIAFILCCTLSLQAQNHTSYRTGSNNDLITTPTSSTVLMGGASEDDNAMQWFLQQANGGDIVILRTSGSDGYNNYMYSSLGVTLNSVETIVCHHPNASQDSYVLQRINEAEGIWFAGGDQWEYISQWRGTPLQTAINNAIARGAVIGGTSAGMAILGDYYFTAQQGTITSNTALQNPYDSNLTIANTPFINLPILNNTITDTHFDNPDRKGRIITFMARMHADDQVSSKAIACDEYTAICISSTGMAQVYGDHPTYDDNAYFIQMNCELSNGSPENCTPNTPLHWDQQGAALKVYTVKGTTNGSATFNLNDWSTASGGQWEHWSVTNGVVQITSGSPINCSTASINTPEQKVILQQTIVTNELELTYGTSILTAQEIIIYDNLGRLVLSHHNSLSGTVHIDVTPLTSGRYFILADDKYVGSIIKIN